MVIRVRRGANNYGKLRSCRRSFNQILPEGAGIIIVSSMTSHLVHTRFYNSLLGSTQILPTVGIEVFKPSQYEC